MAITTPRAGSIANAPRATAMTSDEDLDEDVGLTPGPQASPKRPVESSDLPALPTPRTPSVMSTSQAAQTPVRRQGTTYASPDQVNADKHLLHERSDHHHRSTSSPTGPVLQSPIRLQSNTKVAEDLNGKGKEPAARQSTLSWLNPVDPDGKVGSVTPQPLPVSDESDSETVQPTIQGKVRSLGSCALPGSTRKAVHSSEGKTEESVAKNQAQVPKSTPLPRSTRKAVNSSKGKTEESVAKNQAQSTKSTPLRGWKRRILDDSDSETEESEAEGEAECIKSTSLPQSKRGISDNTDSQVEVPVAKGKVQSIGSKRNAPSDLDSESNQPAAKRKKTSREPQANQRIHSAKVSLSVCMSSLENVKTFLGSAEKDIDAAWLELRNGYLSEEAKRVVRDDFKDMLEQERARGHS